MLTPTRSLWCSLTGQPTKAGTGQNAQLKAQNNYFGFQQGGLGAWGGYEITCPQNPSIPANTKNGCFAMTTTWGQELGLALNSVSGKTGGTYLSALEDA